MPNFMDCHIFLTFQTINGEQLCIVIAVDYEAIPAQTLTVRWETYGPSCPVLFQAAAPAQTIITDFKATDEKSMVLSILPIMILRLSLAEHVSLAAH
jgi:hypothetical protein